MLGAFLNSVNSSFKKGKEGIRGGEWHGPRLLLGLQTQNSP
jgi:hypothetical protein